MKVVYTDKAPAAIGPYSQAIDFKRSIIYIRQIRLIPKNRRPAETPSRFRLRQAQNLGRF